jgi:hypothetical protein
MDSNPNATPLSLAIGDIHVRIHHTVQNILVRA